MARATVARRVDHRPNIDAVVWFCDEILPIEYNDNYVTVFPGETVELAGQAWSGVSANWVRVTGYNTPPQVVAIQRSTAR